MPVFISYSHSDSLFVEQLAKQLVAQKTYVWLWELNVGDSLLQKVQHAVQGASALVVILSKASVASEWCKRELEGGLLRELEEKRVVVLPALIEDCELPIFVRGKLYADFRENVDVGLQALVQGISKVTTDTLGRIDRPTFHVDWAIDWGTVKKDRFYMRITMVEQAIGQPYCCLTIIQILADRVGSGLYQSQSRVHGDQFARFNIIELLTDAISGGQEIRLRLDDQLEQTMEFPLADRSTGAAYLVNVSARRLGEDTGRDILLDVGGQLENIRSGLRGMVRGPTR